MSKITCEHTQTNLIAYLKNGLPVAGRYAITEHLAICDVCSQMLQETKALEADLWAGAVRHRPHLSPEASLRIQKQVYRRMRRALVVKRTVAFFQMAGAVVTAVLLFGGALLFGNQWVAFLSNQSAISGTQSPVSSGQLVVSHEEAVPTAVPQPQSPTPQSPNSLVSTTPGAEPGVVVQAVMEAALTGNMARLSELFSLMRSNKEPTLRMWRNFGQRCGDALTANSLTYQVIPFRPGITARVEMYQNGRFIGDIKVRLINGDWFTFFAPIPSIANCQFAIGHSPFTIYN